MSGLLAIGTTVFSGLCATHLIAFMLGAPTSINVTLAYFDAAFLCVYLAIELGHGGGNPSNRSGL